MAISDSGPPPSCLFYVTDRSSGFRFLVDTGTEVSVIPPSATDRTKQDSFSLQVVNNTPIVTYGNKLLTLNLGLRRPFQWIFIKQPIIGTDFLRHFGLIVDVSHNQLSDSLTQLQIQGISTQSSSPSPTLLPKHPTTEFEAILSEFPEIVQPCNNEQPVKHSITHHIKTTGPPVRAHPRRLPPETDSC